ncbi:hypothetical protein [Candidatus Aalborgicola defluviihabitans]|uniref:hypothetical protein n=1 Tax=Candidatus Aalborgicola defluviihabitans TaxID=3386187 RepID=UPI001DE5596F|nr:hypothetical protein [Burkholderiales bacterium]
MMIHDGYKVGAVTTPPIEDKRLLVMESEFANVLHQAARNGNTLSTTLRSAWDGTSIQPAVKNNPVWASNPHIGLMADITPTELLDMMSSIPPPNGLSMTWRRGPSQSCNLQVPIVTWTVTCFRLNFQLRQKAV